MVIVVIDQKIIEGERGEEEELQGGWMRNCNGNDEVR